MIISYLIKFLTIFVVVACAKKPNEIAQSNPQNPSQSGELLIADCDIKFTRDMTNEDILLTADRMHQICGYDENKILDNVKKIFNADEN